MPLPNGEVLKFFVYIIESPSELDFYHERSEGYLLEKALRLQGIPCITKTAISKEAFEASLKIGISEAMEKFQGLLPIIHISAHGFDDGIQLSTKEIISWDELRKFFFPINSALGGYLLICMSCCDGFAANRMAMYIEDKDHPFLSMVSHYGKPTWDNTAVGYMTFYHLLAKGYYAQEAVEIMKLSSGDKEFIFTTAEKQQKVFLEYALKTKPAFVHERLQQQIGDSTSNQFAKSKT